MNMQRRNLLSRAITLVLLNASGLVAAAEADVPLQDPLPGKAIIYLLRVPNDDVHLEVLLDGAPVANLPPDKYTVISAAAGAYLLSGTTSKEVLPSTALVLKDGERRFFYVSGANANSLGVSTTFLPLFGALAGLLARTGTVDGSRSWKECVELDARGFMSVSSLVLPKRDALS